MPILQGIFKSGEKNTNQIGSELSNENIKTISADNAELYNDMIISKKNFKNEKDNSKTDLSELIPIVKSKKSSSCFQLHSYDNVSIRRVINPVKEEEPPKMERRISLKNEIFKNLRINTIISGIKGLNSAPIKDDSSEEKLIKNGPKTAAIAVDRLEELKISEYDELNLNQSTRQSDHNINNNSDNKERSCSNLSLNAIRSSNNSLKSSKTIGSTPSFEGTAVNNEQKKNEINLDRKKSANFHSDNLLQPTKGKLNNHELTIDTSQPKDKKKKGKLTAIITPSSKSLPWLRERKKSAKNIEVVSAVEPREITALNDNQYAPVSGSTLVSNDSKISDLDESITPSSTPSTASTDLSSSKPNKKKKLFFSKEGFVIGEMKATDVRIIPKLNNEYKEDFHKRVEFDFICSEVRNIRSYNQYLYNPTDLIYNNNKAFFFYEPNISIGSLKDILKNSNGFKDEMDIYSEEMLCTFKKLVNVVNWLHTSMQAIHRRIDPSKILFDTSGQFKLTGLEWAYRITDHDSINVQEEYNFHESIIHEYNNMDKSDPIFFAPEICELNTDYFSKLSTKIDTYSCGMVLAAMNFGYSKVSAITTEQEKCKRYILNNNASNKSDVKLIKYRKYIPDIIYYMLQWKPYERLSLKEVINTEWFKNIDVCSTSPNDISSLENKSDDEIIHTHLNIPGQKCKFTTV